jgi:hypothetical protein
MSRYGASLAFGARRPSSEGQIFVRWVPQLVKHIDVAVPLILVTE